MSTSRRSALKAGAALAAAASFPVFAQSKPKIRFAAVFSEKDIRADMIRMFAKAVANDPTTILVIGMAPGRALITLTGENGKEEMVRFGR